MTAGPDPGGVLITLKDVWIELGRMRDDMTRMGSNSAMLADHETRLRAAEKWRYALPVSALMGVTSVAVTIAGLVIHK